MSVLGFQRRQYLSTFWDRALLTDWLTNWLADQLTDLSPWSWPLLETVLLPQLVKKLPAFYRARRCVTVFTRARHLSISRGRWIQSTLSHPTCLRSILILSSHLTLGLHSDHLPSGFLPKLCIHFSSHIVRNIVVKFGAYLYTLQFPIFVPLIPSVLCKNREGKGHQWCETPRSLCTLFCLAICYFICSTVSQTFVKNSKSSA